MYIIPSRDGENALRYPHLSEQRVLTRMLDKLLEPAVSLQQVLVQVHSLAGGRLQVTTFNSISLTFDGPTYFKSKMQN